MKRVPQYTINTILIIIEQQLLYSVEKQNAEYQATECIREHAIRFVFIRTWMYVMCEPIKVSNASECIRELLSFACFRQNLIEASRQLRMRFSTIGSNHEDTLSAHGISVWTSNGDIKLTHTRLHHNFGRTSYVAYAMPSKTDKMWVTTLAIVFHSHCSMFFFRFACRHAVWTGHALQDITWGVPSFCVDIRILSN